MKYLITGVTGQLGHDIVKELLKRKEKNIYAPTREELDLTDRFSVRKTIYNYEPDVIFHCAAWTNVDLAEDKRMECFDTNVNATRYIAEAAEIVGAKMVYISTDYVFDGSKKEPYKVNDIAHPMNVYGLTKLLGEKEVRSNTGSHFITRISWVFGENAKKNFVKTMLKLAETHNELSVVSDQIGSPTYTEDLAKLLVDMSNTNKFGTYHITNEGYTSWADFARYIFEVADLDVKVNDILTKDYKQTATRPLNSRLDKSLLDENGFERLPDWHDAVKRYVKKIK